MDTDSKTILEDQIRECYARLVWTHKTHEKCADHYTKLDTRFKGLQIILSVILTSGIISVLICDKSGVNVITAIISAILLGVNLYLKNYDLGGISQRFGNTAVSLWDIRERYLSLLTDMQADLVSLEEIRERRDKIQEQLLTVYKSAPRTTPKGYEEASKALKECEEMTFPDGEIDMLLPPTLRKKKSS